MNVAANDPFNPNRVHLKSTLPHLEAIWIAGNNLTCNCHMRALHDASLPPKPALCQRTALGGRTNCDVTTQQPTSPVVKIDPEEYVWAGEARKVPETDTRGCCFHRGMGMQMKVDHARLDELVCATDVLTIFIGIILGPLAFAAAILVAFMCG